MDRKRGKFHVALGTVMLSTASVTKLVLQLLIIPILARLLGPHAFGLMGIAMSFVLLATMLAEGGMGWALVRVDEPDRELKSTIFWLSSGIGLCLAAIICLLGWPASLIFGDPVLFPMLCALSPIMIISASLSVSNADIVREQRFDYFAAGDVGCAVLSAAAGIAMAFGGYGIWSLVAQQLVHWVCKAAWILTITGFRPGFVIRPSLARPLIRFSANNLAANLVSYIGKSAPILIVSSVVGVSAAGQYSMGSQFSRVTDMVVSDPIKMATFSAVSGAGARHVAAQFVTRALRILIILLAPLCVGLMLTAGLITAVLLGPKWIETAPILAALAPGTLILCFYSFANAAMLGEGLSGRVFKLTAVKSLALAVGAAIGAYWGAVGAALGFTLGAAAVAPSYVWYLASSMRVSVGDLLSAVGPGALATSVMAGCVMVARAGFADSPPAVQLAIAVGVGVVSYIVVMLWLEGPQIYGDFIRIRNRKRDGAAAMPAMQRDAAAPDVSA